MALLAVLWLVAALSIMLSGMLHVVRSEVGIAGQSRKIVLYSGLADAAIRLTLQELAFDKTLPTTSIQTRNILVFGTAAKVEVIPLTGRVNLNSAPASLLADTFEYGAGVSKESASRLANLVVEARDLKGAQGESQKFHAVEDLLWLAELDFDVYAKLKNVLTVDADGSGLVNPLAASLETLVILAKGDQARASQLLDSRLTTPGTVDTTTLTATHIEMVSTSYLAIRATLPTQDGASVVRTWYTDIASPANGLPWRVLRVEQSVMTDTPVK